MRWLIDYLFPRSFSVDDIPDLAGKVVIVTGGCSGIGYEVARQCASHNARRIIIVSPPSPTLDEAVCSISAKVSNALGHFPSQFRPLTQ
jgi:NAD(P)-dependent dehydrogenase (short-subunit alcohol dehydrogenase family)